MAIGTRTRNFSVRLVGLVILLVFLLILLIWMVFLRTPAGPFVESFVGGDEGWLVVGDAQDESNTPDHHTEGGNPGAHLSATDDAVGGVWYWAAPEKFRTRFCTYLNWSRLKRPPGKRAKLIFDLKQSSLENPFDDEDVIAGRGKKELYAKIEAPPGTDWTSYSVSLNAEDWIDSSTGDTATPEDFAEIFSDLDRLLIRGEFRTGDDVGGLDNAGIREPVEAEE